MNKREKVCHYLFQKSAEPYAKLFKKKQLAWNLTANDLLKYPQDTLGYKVGVFLSSNGFEFFPKHETHDVFHVITDYGITVKEEIGLQYLLYGNGKRSVYLYLVLFLGFILLPEHYSFYLQSYRKGKSIELFYQKVNKDFLHKKIKEI